MRSWNFCNKTKDYYKIILVQCSQFVWILFWSFPILCTLWFANRLFLIDEAKKKLQYIEDVNCKLLCAFSAFVKGTFYKAMQRLHLVILKKSFRERMWKMLTILWPQKKPHLHYSSYNTLSRNNKMYYSIIEHDIHETLSWERESDDFQLLYTVIHPYPWMPAVKKYVK